MRSLRHFVRTQRRGGLLAVYLAYALAIQGLMASVGLGMAAGAAPGEAGFVLCSYVAHRTLPIPGDRHAPAPQCPFCFVAAQSVGHFTAGGDAAALPAYAGAVVATIPRPLDDGLSVPDARHRLGEPRAPPSASV